MELLFVSHKYPPSTGGMEKQSYELITGMAKYCKVHAIVYDGNGGLAAFFFSLQRKIVSMCAAYPDIRIIHYNDGLLAAFCLWHNRYPHLKRTVTLHGLDVVFPSAIYHRYIFPRFNKFERIMAVSAATAEKSVFFGIKREKLTVIRNGINVAALQQQNVCNTFLPLRPDNRRVLVMMGRPVLRKGFSWFVREVLPLLKGDFRLLMIGPFSAVPTGGERLLYLLPARVRKKLMLFLGYPSDGRELRRLLKAPLLAPKVEHLGRLSYAEIRTVFSCADAFLMPNIGVDGDMEGFGLVCLEASLMGVPVFAAAADGIPDAIRHGQNGFLLPSNEPGAWAEQLNRLIEDPRVFKKYAPGFAQYTAEHYNSENMVNAYYDEFRSV